MPLMQTYHITPIETRPTRQLANVIYVTHPFMLRWMEDVTFISAGGITSFKPTLLKCPLSCLLLICENNLDHSLWEL